MPGVDVIDRLIAFAKNDQNISVLILEGSQATGKKVDILSDFDINVFTDNLEFYLEQDEWLSNVGNVLFYKKDHFRFANENIEMRLVLFDTKERIDFSFWKLRTLSEIVSGNKVYESYQNGFKVLLDKTGITAKMNLKPGNGFQISKPDEDEYLDAIFCFWFEAYSVVRHLARNDLWYARLIENRTLKDVFYRVTIWHYLARRDWTQDSRIHLWGKYFGKWMPQLVSEREEIFFSPKGEEIMYDNVISMLDVFCKQAREVGKYLNFEYPLEREAKFIEYLGDIHAIFGKNNQNKTV